MRTLPFRSISLRLSVGLRRSSAWPASSSSKTNLPSPNRFRSRFDAMASLSKLPNCLEQTNGKVTRADLILLDLMLPDGSGFDLIVQVRRNGLRPAIIVLSSRDEEADRVAALETGADDYVTKPFSPREVVARRARCASARPNRKTTAHWSSPQPSVPTPLPVLPVQVDASTRRATVHGTVLELTRVEFDLLACLVEEPGRVYTPRPAHRQGLG